MKFFQEIIHFSVPGLRSSTIDLTGNKLETLDEDWLKPILDGDNLVNLQCKVNELTFFLNLFTELYFR